MDFTLDEVSKLKSLLYSAIEEENLFNKSESGQETEIEKELYKQSCKDLELLDSISKKVDAFFNKNFYL